jgi:hypothetical protein
MRVFNRLELQLQRKAGAGGAAQGARSTWISCAPAGREESFPLFSVAYEIRPLPVFRMQGTCG